MSEVGESGFEIIGRQISGYVTIWGLSGVGRIGQERSPVRVRVPDHSVPLLNHDGLTIGMMDAFHDAVGIRVDGRIVRMGRRKRREMNRCGLSGRWERLGGYDALTLTEVALVGRTGHPVKRQL